ncbi:hypothetical protein BKA69DRAFT_661743 [Paraphysoderma sedebokerense]|nr:hypothetical protein BKA69DRAFT_661743 [Paraphysoderma sedebokerense]
MQSAHCKTTSPITDTELFKTVEIMFSVHVHLVFNCLVFLPTSLALLWTIRERKWFPPRQHSLPLIKENQPPQPSFTTKRSCDEFAEQERLPSDCNLLLPHESKSLLKINPKRLRRTSSILVDELKPLIDIRSIFNLYLILHSIFYMAELLFAQILTEYTSMAIHHIIALSIFYMTFVTPSLLSFSTILPYWLHSLYWCVGGGKDRVNLLILYNASLLGAAIVGLTVYARRRSLLTWVLPLLAIAEIFVNYWIYCLHFLGDWCVDTERLSGELDIIKSGSISSWGLTIAAMIIATKSIVRGHEL